MADLIELSIERIGGAGDGVASYRGERVFVPFTAPGDRVRARIGQRRNGGIEASPVAILEAGPGRTEPLCPHFGRCGGCALQHLASAAYRAAKLDGLHAALRRIGVDTDLVGSLRSVPAARRRARLGLERPRDPRQPARVGYRERFRHALVDIAQCPVLEPALFAVIEPLRRALPEALPPGTRAEAALTHTDGGVDLLFEADATPGLSALEALAALAEEIDLARVVWRNGRGETPVVERRKPQIVTSGVAVPFPPGGFIQPSAAAEAILAQEIVAGLGARRPALDLYAGLGVFALALAGRGPVHAVEGDERAAAALAQAAAGVAGVSVERRDLARNPLRPEELSRFAAAVFDPPRAGAIEQAAALAASDLEAVAAVSCNPATFARDAARLIAGGFRLERLVPIDQFVWTPHLEIVAIFRR
jgi:23S rRNA (uracil1939-C5)-methyltransferase